MTGFATAGVNPLLILVMGLPMLVTNTVSALVLGILAGIPVLFGIRQEMGEGSGLSRFGQAALALLVWGRGGSGMAGWSAGRRAGIRPVDNAHQIDTARAKFWFRSVELGRVWTWQAR